MAAVFTTKPIITRILMSAQTSCVPFTSHRLRRRRREDGGLVSGFAHVELGANVLQLLPRRLVAERGREVRDEEERLTRRTLGLDRLLGFLLHALLVHVGAVLLGPRRRGKHHRRGGGERALVARDDDERLELLELRLVALGVRRDRAERDRVADAAAIDGREKIGPRF